jgi:hypothetical protein
MRYGRMFIEAIQMPQNIQLFLDFLVSTGVTAGVVSAAVVWISKEWLSQKIKSQIESEYEHRLESYKAQLKGDYDQKLETHKAQLKAQGDVEIERLKSELSIAAAQRQALFSNLHERRAEVITEVYASLKGAISALADYTKAFEPDGGATREARRKTAVDSLNAFAVLYDKKKIFIPEGAARKLDEMNLELKQAFLQFAYGVDLMRDKGHDYAQKWLDIGKKVENLSNIAIAELERDFRILLGDEAH